MEDEKILEVVFDNENDWTDEQIGAFVRIALTEDKTEEDIKKELGIRRAD